MKYLNPSKKFFFILLFAFTTQSFAAEPIIDVACVTETPTTSFFLVEKNGQVDVRVMHHNGSAYIPFRSSLITPSDIPVLSKQAALLAKLGDTWEFTFKRADCQVDAPLFFQCLGDATSFQQNGIKVRPYSISVTDTVQKTLWGNFHHKALKLSFEVGEGTVENLQIENQFLPGECMTQEQSNHRSRPALAPALRR